MLSGHQSGGIIPAFLETYPSIVDGISHAEHPYDFPHATFDVCVPEYNGHRLFSFRVAKFGSLLVFCRSRMEGIFRSASSFRADFLPDALRQQVIEFVLSVEIAKHFRATARNMLRFVGRIGHDNIQRN